MNQRTVNNDDQRHSTVHISWTDKDVDEAVELQVQECARHLGVDPALLLEAVLRGDLGAGPPDHRDNIRGTNSVKAAGALKDSNRNQRPGVSADGCQEALSNQRTDG